MFFKTWSINQAWGVFDANDRKLTVLLDRGDSPRIVSSWIEKGSLILLFQKSNQMISRLTITNFMEKGFVSLNFLNGKTAVERTITPATIGQLVSAQVINGDGQSNSLTGTDAHECIYGYGGNDAIRAGGGNDTVYGGGGSDTVFGGAGYDILVGGEGNDNLQGGADSDTLYGGTGNDWLNGGAGDDQLYGGDGDDWLVFDGGNDRFDGGLGLDNYKIGLAAGSVEIRNWIVVDTLYLPKEFQGSLRPDYLSGHVELNVGQTLLKIYDAHILNFSMNRVQYY